MATRTYEELEAIMDADLSLFEGLIPAREVKFKTWLPDNMHIYRAFVDYARQIKGRGREYFSARTIWELIRWETIIADKPEGHYKMSDLNMPFVSWLSMKAEPELKGMFKQKRKAVI